jgi:hypothetical protein
VGLAKATWWLAGCNNMNYKLGSLRHNIELKREVSDDAISAKFNQPAYR